MPLYGMMYGMHELETASLEITAASDREGDVEVIVTGLNHVKTYGQLIELHRALGVTQNIIARRLNKFRDDHNIDDDWTLEQVNMLAANTTYEEQS